MASGPDQLRRHAEHHDLVIDELDAGRSAGARRPQRPVGADLGIGDLAALDLAERDRHTERARRPRQPHRFERVAGRHAGAAPVRIAHALRREQRALDLHVVHIGRNRRCRRPPWRRARRTRLARSAQRVRDARTAAAACAPGLSRAPGRRRRRRRRRSNTIQCGAIPPSVPPDITRQMRAASSGGSAVGTSGSAPASHAAREVVDQAVALGLGQIARMPFGSMRPRRWRLRYRSYRRARTRRCDEPWRSA